MWDKVDALSNIAAVPRHMYYGTVQYCSTPKRGILDSPPRRGPARRALIGVGVGGPKIDVPNFVRLAKVNSAPSPDFRM